MACVLQSGNDGHPMSVWCVILRPAFFSIVTPEVLITYLFFLLYLTYNIYTIFLLKRIKEKFAFIYETDF